MGTFRQSFEVRNFRGDRFEAIDAQEDTGATYTTVPTNILRRLGVQSEEQGNFLLIVGSSTDR